MRQVSEGGSRVIMLLLLDRIVQTTSGYVLYIQRQATAMYEIKQLGCNGQVPLRSGGVCCTWQSPGNQERDTLDLAIAIAMALVPSELNVTNGRALTKGMRWEAEWR